jgi:chlorobactene glucosyltransferase
MNLLELTFIVLNLVPMFFITALIVMNTVFFKRLTGFTAINTKAVTPRVSVLVPARNEAKNLPVLIPTLLNQSYPNLEIIILDDHSDDATLQIASDFALKDLRLQVVQGGDLRHGWLGKPNASRQLAERATGEILIFTDADTIWSNQAVQQIVTAMQKTKADALSAWCGQILTDWFAKLVTPWATWSILAFLPLWLVPNKNFPRVATANGQLLVFRRACYDAIGGFETVKQDLLEDRALALLVKARGFRFELFNGVGSVDCQMYSSVQETYNGYVKGAFAAVDHQLSAMVLRFGLLAWLFVVPWLFLPFSELAWISVGLALLGRFITDKIFGFSPMLFLGQLFGHVSAIFITLASWRRYKQGRLAWKGRLVVGSRRVSSS